MCIKDYSWNPSTCIGENRRHLKHIVDNIGIAWNEIMYVIDIVSSNMTNAISTNAWTNYDGKKVRYETSCYIFHTVLLVITLLFIFSIICYQYATHRSKLKKVLPCKQYKNRE